jgi:hypothetical protein
MIFDYIIKKSEENDKKILFAFNDDLTFKNPFTFELNEFIKEKYFEKTKTYDVERFFLDVNYLNEIKDNNEILEQIYTTINLIVLDLNQAKNGIIELLTNAYSELIINEKMDYYKLFLLSNSVDDLIRFFIFHLSRIDALNDEKHKNEKISQKDKSISLLLYNEMVLTNRFKILGLFKDLFLIKNTIEKYQKKMNEKESPENIFFINVDKNFLNNKKEIIDDFVEEYYPILNKEDLLKTKIQTNILFSKNKDNKIYVYRFSDDKKDLLNEMIKIAVSEEKYEKADIIKKVLSAFE